MLATTAQLDLLGGVLGFLMTVALLSYLLGDNPLYRLALHIFIGLSIGYIGLITIYQVLIPRLVTPLLSGNSQLNAITLVPLVLFLFLAMKLSPNTASLGNTGVGYLVGVGTGVAVGGALTGTLLPQIQATWLPIMPGSDTSIINNAIIIIGTVTSLVYFQYWFGRDERKTVSKSRFMIVFSAIGQGFIMITLATIYSGMILSSIAIFSAHLGNMIEWASFLLP